MGGKADRQTTDFRPTALVGHNSPLKRKAMKILLYSLILTGCAAFIVGCSSTPAGGT